MPFTIRKLRTLDAAFKATLVEDGEDVAEVENDGRGGCHRWYWHDRDAEARFSAEAKRVYPTVTFEVEDHYLVTLTAYAEMARKRSPLLLLDDDLDTTDPEWDGSYRVVPSRFTLEETIAAYSAPAYADRNPRIFVPAVQRFLPVAEAAKAVAS